MILIIMPDLRVELVAGRAIAGVDVGEVHLSSLS